MNNRDESFVLVGIRPIEDHMAKKSPWYKGKPLISMALLGIIIMGSLCCGIFISGDPAYMNLSVSNSPPSESAWFGTDSMGRNIFSMIWYGGRVSLFIGVLGAFISTVIGVVLGAFSGLAPSWMDTLLMRFTEIVLSIPDLLLIVLIQAVLGKANVLSVALVIGVTSWTSIAKVVRTEVRQIKGSEYILAARCMGGGFFYILRRHLAPNFISSIMFMVVMNLRSAIIAESTLSFMGIGLPLETVSWGSMLSMSERALLTGSWWIILIPGIFLITTLVSITSIGHCLRKRMNRRESNL